MRLVDTFKASLDPYLFRLYRRYLYSRYKATDELAHRSSAREDKRKSAQDDRQVYAKQDIF